MCPRILPPACCPSCALDTMSDSLDDVGSKGSKRSLQAAGGRSFELSKRPSPVQSAIDEIGEASSPAAPHRAIAEDGGARARGLQAPPPPAARSAGPTGGLAAPPTPSLEPVRRLWLVPNRHDTIHG